MVSFRKNRVVVRVEAEQRERQLLAQFGQDFAQQLLLAHEQRGAFRPAGRHIGENEGVNKAAARRGSAMGDEVGFDEARLRVLPVGKCAPARCA